ncbi:MAG: efflux RND transporter periplasmic adaptor subunit [Pseudomonadota bacterium]
MNARCLLLGAALAAALPALASAEQPQGATADSVLVFEGRVQASRSAVVSTRLDGVVAEVLFRGGERVRAGQPLIRLDPADAELALAVADARVAQAEAELAGAVREATRQEALFARGISPDAVVGPARTARTAAEATLALARAEREQAAVDLARTVIPAPIDGFVSAPAVVVGQFLEAEAGPPLATVVALDPVTVAYRAPYADRLRVLAATGARTVDQLLAGIRLRLVLPGERAYPATAVPSKASPTVDPSTGTVTVWASFPNPDGLLRPGMAVTVLSDVSGETP